MSLDTITIGGEKKDGGEGVKSEVMVFEKSEGGASGKMKEEPAEPHADETKEKTNRRTVWKRRQLRFKSGKPEPNATEMNELKEWNSLNTNIETRWVYYRQHRAQKGGYNEIDCLQTKEAGVDKYAGVDQHDEVDEYYEAKEEKEDEEEEELDEEEEGVDDENEGMDVYEDADDMEENVDEEEENVGEEEENVGEEEAEKEEDEEDSEEEEQYYEDLLQEYLALVSDSGFVEDEDSSSSTSF